MIYSKASKSDHRGDLNEKGYPSVRYDLSKSQLPFYYPHHKGYGRSQRRFCNRYLVMKRYLVLAGVSLLLFFLWFSLTYTSPTLKIYNRKRSLGDPLATLNTSHLGQQLPFQGRAMKGTHGGVAVEAQECADVGTGSKWTVYRAVGSGTHVFVCLLQLNVELHMLVSFETRWDCSRCRYCLCSLYRCPPRLCYR